MRWQSHRFGLRGLERFQPLRLVLDGAQCQPARQRRDINTARRLGNGPAYRNEDIRTRAGRFFSAGQHDPRIDRAVAEINLAGDTEIGIAAVHGRLGQPELPGIHRIDQLRARHRELAAVESAFDNAGDASGIDDDALIDGAGDSVRSLFLKLPGQYC